MSAPLRHALAGTALLLAVLTGCNTGGTGLFHDYNAKVVVQTDDLQRARTNTRLHVETNHQGTLEKEETVVDDGESVLTFVLPADQFDPAISGLDDTAIGTVLSRDLRGYSDIARRSELSRVSDSLDKQLTQLIGDDTSDTAADVQNAQKQLDELADRSNQPVLVVQLLQAPGLWSKIWAFVTSRVLWVVLVGAGGFLLGRRKGSDNAPARPAPAVTVPAAPTQPLPVVAPRRPGAVDPEHPRHRHDSDEGEDDDEPDGLRVAKKTVIIEHLPPEPHDDDPAPPPPPDNDLPTGPLPVPRKGRRHPELFPDLSEPTPGTM